MVCESTREWCSKSTTYVQNDVRTKKKMSIFIRYVHSVLYVTETVCLQDKNPYVKRAQNISFELRWLPAFFAGVVP